MRYMWLFGAAFSLVVGACGSEEDMGMADELEPCGAVLADKADGAKSDPNTMPLEVVKWQRKNMWGSMHIHFHVGRRWDVMDSSGKSWAKGEGIKRAALQEGQPGSGVEFLAMHRLMIGLMKTNFPKHAALFTGFAQVPTNPRDAKYPLPRGGTQTFDANFMQAVDKLQNKLTDFASDDEFAVYLQTSLRPTAGNPGNKSTDQSSGIHNYLHVRYSDSVSAINVGDPAVNLENRVFWAIHGYIDARWTAYRAAKGLNDMSDTNYRSALQHAQDVMDAIRAGKADSAACVEVPADVVPQLFSL